MWGLVQVPLGTTDYSGYLLRQAQLGVAAVSGLSAQTAKRGNPLSITCI